MKLLLGFALGVAVGGVAAVALLPGREQRFRELVARLAEGDRVGRLIGDIEGASRHALAVARERYQLALAEARQARAEAQRDLWARYQEAKRQGRLPPG